MSEGYGDEARVVWAPTCWRCKRRLAEYLATPYSIRCHSCKATNREGPSQSPPGDTVNP